MDSNELDLSQYQWGSDVRVSMPQPLQDYTAASVPMYGFRFTLNGLMHDLTPTDWERIVNAPLQPVSPSQVERGDLDVGGA